MELPLEHMSLEQLREVVRKKEKENIEKENKIKKLEEDYQHSEQEREKLEKKFQDIIQQFCSMKFELSQLKRLIYGSKRERFISKPDDNQLALPFEVEQAPAEEHTQKENIEYTRRKKNQNHQGRLPLPDHLPVEEILIEPKEDTEGLNKIGEEITDELEYVPSILKIKRYIRPKYAELNNEGVVVGELPVRPIPKCIAGPGLLAQIMVDKFVDHCPVYRQVKRFEREGVKIPKSTISGWQSETAKLLWVLYNELKRQVLGQGYLQVDETPIRVLDKRKKGKCHIGYHWIYHSPIQKLVFFDYREGRGREGPKELLRNFKGYLQTDGYNVYEWFATKEGIKTLNCMAHARRMFEKSLTDDKKRAEYAMVEIQKLYKIERKARDEGLSPQQRYELRLDESLPLLNNLGKWMAEQARTTIPQSPLGKALKYSINRWDNLMVYLNDGYLEIDNNLVENAIRPNALGRKNYLFAGSHEGAKRAAMMYSFFGTCKKHNVNPYQWLKKVLEIIPEYPANKVADLLPHNLSL